MKEANSAGELCEKMQEEEERIIMEGFTEAVHSKSWEWSNMSIAFPLAPSPVQQLLGGSKRWDWKSKQKRMLRALH